MSRLFASDDQNPGTSASVYTCMYICVCVCVCVFIYLCYVYIGEGSGNPLQYSHLGNPMDRGAWQAIVHMVAKSQL